MKSEETDEEGKKMKIAAMPTLHIFLLVISTLTAKAYGEEERQSPWHPDEIAAGTFPGCLFSDSGLGREKKNLGGARVYCPYHASVKWENDDITFTRASLALFLGTHSIDDNPDDDTEVTMYHRLYSTSVDYGLRLPLGGPFHIEAGAGVFAAYRTRDIVTWEEDSDDMDRKSAGHRPLSGIKAYISPRCGIEMENANDLDMGIVLEFYHEFNGAEARGESFVPLPSIELALSF
jgi:hypothetical protein